MGWYPKDVFLGCHECGVLHPIDTSPGVGDDEASLDQYDAQRAFLAAHWTHAIACLFRGAGDSIADRPLWDPMATVRFPITDGLHDYIACGTRSTIDEPRVYTFTPGQLELGAPEVSIADADVRRGLDREFYPNVLRPPKLDRFIELIHDAVRQVSPTQLDVAFDDADDPMVSIAPMPDGVYERVVTRSAEIFDPWEWPRVQRFLRENRGDDGLLVLRVRRQISPAAY